MSRDPTEVPLPDAKFEPSTTTTVEMTEIDGMEQGAVLRFTDVGKSGKPSEDRQLRTCYGDLYVIVNALRDYANMLESVVPEWGLTGYHAATYELHAARCREIAGKYADSIGYDYDKAVERCEKRRAKGGRGGDTGMDGLEALVRKREIRPQKKDKSDPANGHREETRMDRIKNQRVRVFDSEEQARKFLTDAGVGPEELQHMKFMENE